jgi:transposase
MEKLFTEAIGMSEPWYVEKVEFQPGIKEGSKHLHIYVNHKTGVKFRVEKEGEEYSVYDHQERTWRHLNFFEHECYLHARLPRVKTSSGYTLLVDVPWAKPGSSFTLLFESYVCLLVKEGMSFSGVGRYMGISGKRVYTIIKNKTLTALVHQNVEEVEEASLDETSYKKGHDYFTVLTDRKRKKVVGISTGKDQEAVNQALIDMEVRGGSRQSIQTITMDMSRSYISAVDKYIPQAEIVFDRFHIEQHMNKVVDEVRKEESKQYTELKRNKYLWLRNKSNLKEDKKLKLNVLARSYPRLGKVHRLKEQLKEVLNEAAYSNKLAAINRWLKIAWRSGINQVQDFVNMIHSHWYGIKTYFTNLKTNAYAERVNLKIQEIKRIARGYSKTNNFIIMIYFHLGGLDLGLPTKNG